MYFFRTFPERYQMETCKKMSKKLQVYKTLQGYLETPTVKVVEEKLKNALLRNVRISLKKLHETVFCARTFPLIVTVEAGVSERLDLAATFPQLRNDTQSRARITVLKGTYIRITRRFSLNRHETGNH